MLVEVFGGPGGIELCEEDGAPFGLVSLTDFGRGATEAGHRSKEPPIGGLDPADRPGTSPAGSAELIESAVIPDPKGGITLYRITTEPCQLGPRIAEPRPSGDDGGHGIALSVRWLGQGIGERLGGGGFGRLQHRLGRAALVDVNGSLCHVGLSVVAAGADGWGSPRDGRATRSDHISDRGVESRRAHVAS